MLAARLPAIKFLAIAGGLNIAFSYINKVQAKK